MRDGSKPGIEEGREMLTESQITLIGRWLWRGGFKWLPRPAFYRTKRSVIASFRRLKLDKAQILICRDGNKGAPRLCGT